MRNFELEVLEDLQRQINRLQTEVKRLAAAEPGPVGRLRLRSGVLSVPVGQPTAAVVYVDAEDGDLKVTFSNGKTVTLAADDLG